MHKTYHYILRPYVIDCIYVCLCVVVDNCVLVLFLFSYKYFSFSYANTTAFLKYWRSYRGRKLMCYVFVKYPITITTWLLIWELSDLHNEQES